MNDHKPFITVHNYRFWLFIRLGLRKKHASTQGRCNNHCKCPSFFHHPVVRPPSAAYLWLSALSSCRNRRCKFRETDVERTVPCPGIAGLNPRSLLWPAKICAVERLEILPLPMKQLQQQLQQRQPPQPTGYNHWLDGQYWLVFPSGKCYNPKEADSWYRQMIL